MAPLQPSQRQTYLLQETAAGNCTTVQNGTIGCVQVGGLTSVCFRDRETRRLSSEDGVQDEYPNKDRTQR